MVLIYIAGLKGKKKKKSILSHIKVFVLLKVILKLGLNFHKKKDSIKHFFIIKDFLF